MPDLTTVVLAVGAWMVLVLLVLALCGAAGHSDREHEALAADEAAPREAGAPYVVDTGGLRAHLRDAVGLVDADHLAVLIDVGGRNALVAASRPLVAADAGDWHTLRVPVRRAGRDVAVLQALRRPSRSAFEPDDRAALEALAASLGETVEATHDATRRLRPPGRVSA